MVRSYGHVGSLVTWVAVVTGVTASTTGGPMINEASGRPVTYHPRVARPRVPVYEPSGVAIPDGLGHAP